MKSIVKLVKLKQLYPLAMINVTNRCTLKCKHCFVFRDGNPNIPTEANEMPTDVMMKEIKRIRNERGIFSMVWMGGEPLLRKDVLKRGVKLFPRNVITTNGTLPLFPLGKKTKWVVSLDGPEEINDEIRGDGCFKRVLHNLNSLPDDFEGDLQSQCVVSKKNEDQFEGIIDILRDETPVRGLTFSFYAAKKKDTTDFAWATLKERDRAVKKALRLKKQYPDFILNRELGIELLLSQNALEVTNNCPIKKFFFPIYLGEKGFVHPSCCYGNDVNCDLCGAWGAFQIAAMRRTDPSFLKDFV